MFLSESLYYKNNDKIWNIMNISKNGRYNNPNFIGANNIIDVFSVLQIM